MKIEGTHKIAAPRERVFQALIDPSVLKKCIPGCESLDKTGDNTYNAKLTAGVGPIRGSFTGTVSLQDVNPPSHFQMTLEGKGQPGFVKGSGNMDFSEDGEGTMIKYTAEVNIGGMIAGVGQRMIQAASGMMAGKFFGALENEVKAAQASTEQTR